MDPVRRVVRFTLSRIVQQMITILIVVVQGGKGACSKLAPRAAEDDAPAASTSATRAEEQHPQSMSGLLPRSLIAALARETFPAAADVNLTGEALEEPTTITQYQHLFAATSNVSVSARDAAVLAFFIATPTPAFALCSCCSGADLLTRRVRALPPLKRTRLTRSQAAA